MICRSKPPASAQYLKPCARGLIAGTVAACWASAGLSALPAFAQQPQPAPQVGTPPAQKAAKPAAPKAPKPEAAAAGPSSGGDAALRQRIEGLEEQLVDMQVVIGTLESLAKSSGAASASPAYRAGGAAADVGSGVDAARIAGLEAQVRSLTQQVQQLNDQVRSLGGSSAGQGGQVRREGNAGALGVPSPVAAAPATGAPGWGAASVATARADGSDTGPYGEVVSGALPPVAAAAPATDPASAKQAYEAAYQYLLQQDYGAAEVAFDDFLKRYPNDTLAGNAQFWLGESHYVRGQFKAAASAFLKGYQTYARSSKAPDSLLKLAMSLGRLGQKDAACSSLNELGTRFPSATADVKSRAAAEKQRTGCP